MLLVVGFKENPELQHTVPNACMFRNCINRMKYLQFMHKSGNKDRPKPSSTHLFLGWTHQLLWKKKRKTPHTIHRMCRTRTEINLSNTPYGNMMQHKHKPPTTPLVLCLSMMRLRADPRKTMVETCSSRKTQHAYTISKTCHAVYILVCYKIAFNWWIHILYNQRNGWFLRPFGKRSPSRILHPWLKWLHQNHVQAISQWHIRNGTSQVQYSATIRVYSRLSKLTIDTPHLPATFRPSCFSFSSSFFSRAALRVTSAKPWNCEKASAHLLYITCSWVTASQYLTGQQDFKNL